MQRGVRIGIIAAAIIILFALGGIYLLSSQSTVEEVPSKTLETTAQPITYESGLEALNNPQSNDLFRQCIAMTTGEGWPSTEEWPSIEEFCYMEIIRGSIVDAEKTLSLESCYPLTTSQFRGECYGKVAVVERNESHCVPLETEARTLCEKRYAEAYADIATMNAPLYVRSFTVVNNDANDLCGAGNDCITLELTHQAEKPLNILELKLMPVKGVTGSPSWTCRATPDGVALPWSIGQAITFTCHTGSGSSWNRGDRITVDLLLEYKYVDSALSFSAAGAMRANSQ